MMLRALPRRRARAAAAVLAAVCCGACNTAFTARLPRVGPDAASAKDTIDHCLASLGFAEEAPDPLAPNPPSDEPELVAVWSTPFTSAWTSSTSQTVASVRRFDDGWTVSFISRGSGYTAEALSTAFSRCVPVHDPNAAVEVETQRFLDLR